MAHWTDVCLQPSLSLHPRRAACACSRLQAAAASCRSSLLAPLAPPVGGSGAAPPCCAASRLAVLLCGRRGGRRGHRPGLLPLLDADQVAQRAQLAVQFSLGGRLVVRELLGAGEGGQGERGG